MKLLFKQRMFSWFDSYDIYNEIGDTVYTVKGQFSWGHCLKIFDSVGNEIGMIKERIFTWLPKFEMYIGGSCVGSINREFTLLRPRYRIDCKGWQVNGHFFEWDYTVTNTQSQTIATVSKEPFNWTDTYVLDIVNPHDALCVLMLVLAIDAEKCSRKD